MTAPSVGTFLQWGVDTANPITKIYELERETFQAKPQHVETNGIRGTRSHPSENVVVGLIPVDGPIEVIPIPTFLSDWALQAILGGAPTGVGPKTYPLAETLPSYYMQFDRIAKVFTYNGCKVNRATFRSAEGQNLALTLEMAGLTETVGNAGSFPGSPTAIPLEAPFQHQSSTITVNATTYRVKDVEIVFDNHLDLQFYNNSQSRTALPELDRTVSLSFTTPWSADETALYLQAINAGIGGTVVYTNGTKTLTFTFVALQSPTPTPTVPGKVVIPQRLTFTARMLSTTKEVVVTM